MENKKLSLMHWYIQALSNQDIHTCTTMDLSTVHVDELFEGRNSQRFIKQYFKHLTDTPFEKNSTNKFIDILNKITEFRAQHTVASFLLGIVVKENLSLDVRDWIRIYDLHSSDPSFGFFWSLICLTHDVAYYLERNSKKLLSNMKTVDDFCVEHSIHYNLLNYSNNEALIRQYYLYRSEQDSKIDHGITGALLIFDALMAFYEENKSNPAANLCGIHLRKSFPVFCLKISETIALHNMWRATKDSISLYKEYHLDELIPNDNHIHIIDYKDDTLLFLLGLIDTIDPIKAFCNSEGRGTRIPVDIVLNEYCFSFVDRSGAKRISIQFDQPEFAKRYRDNLIGLAKWLSVDVKTTDNSAEIYLKSYSSYSTSPSKLQAG